MEKRLYSLNCSAYVATVTNIMPVVRKDEENGTAYFVFPECEGVKSAIHWFKDGQPNVALHEFLTSIRFLRQAMKEVLQNGDKDNR